MPESLPPLVGVDEVLRRLQTIFPREAFDAAVSNPLGAQAITAMLYGGAVIADDDVVTKQHTIVKPTTCLWLQESVLVTRTADDERRAWIAAAAAHSNAKKKTQELVESWDLTFHPPYKDGTREPLRDETFAAWLDRGAIKSLPDVQTNYPNARWALTSSFASLFDPALTGPELGTAIEAWRTAHLGRLDLVRVQTLRDRDREAHSVEVRLPNGRTRHLEPGDSSRILKGVIEQWAAERLADPVVLTISEPGDKVYVIDDAFLARLGILIDQRSLLPDAVIIDIGADPAMVWIVEAVASDGPVNEGRRADLLAWAVDQRIDPNTCRFLSAFLSRNHSAARRRLKDLAVGTYAWYLDEPSRELSWHEISEER
ncbi:BsuBI/PstI family type II restriction endonuclease [Actinotalea sp. JY-7885]|uniref:BsuBI/PstI family type II restriction endonuclease n=1 Tax=Actinotalea sp. JY-7885 TaxID=2758576 RepID=UPI001CB73D3D|nr:BsuBI/PstI family type II restriction endonuclease [Actinotalea sp. JY-7885]